MRCAVVNELHRAGRWTRMNADIFMWKEKEDELVVENIDTIISYLLLWIKINLIVARR